MVHQTQASAHANPNANLNGGLNGRVSGLGREQLSEIQRARILTAMLTVLAEHGAANVSVANVVANSGVSRRTFYELFEDREDCFLETLDDAIKRVSDTVIPAYEHSGSWRTKIRAALTALLECFEEDPSTARLLIIETLAAGPRALECRQDLLEQIIPHIDQGRLQSKRPGSPPPLTAEATLGGALSILHARLAQHEHTNLIQLVGPLTSMIILPYQGPAAARKELKQPDPTPKRTQAHAPNPLHNLDIRLTYRTICVLTATATHPGSSNRQIGNAAGMHDQGQTSKILARLHHHGLLQNTTNPTKGAPNSWTLTKKGAEIEQAISNAR
jgi:AcrR family transcriptional regulator/DNA-binding MarR family transcriptional regulator